MSQPWPAVVQAEAQAQSEPRTGAEAEAASAVPLAAATGIAPAALTGPGSREAVVFGCEGAALVGVLHRSTGCLGMVIVVGGPQYRAGSHRHFVAVAEAAAAAGHPTLRFDARGMGDSGGEAPGFEHLAPDIGAAIDALFARQPQLVGVVLWGLCDGASAVLMYLHARHDRRVAGLCLVNPWVRSPTSQARAQVRHYYVQRLRDPNFWRKLARGGVAPTAWREFVGQWRRARAPAAPLGGHASAQALPPDAPFQQRMLAGWQAFRGPVLLALSGQDYTATEFIEHSRGDPAWQALLDAAHTRRCNLPQADHTLSREQDAQALNDALCSWMAGLARQPVPAQAKPPAAAGGPALAPARSNTPAAAVAQQPGLTMTPWAQGRGARALYVVHRLLQRVSGGHAALHVYLLCAQPIGQGAYAAVRDDANSPVRRLHAGDALLGGLPRPAAALAQRFAAGHECHAIEVKGEFAGCIWLARGAYDEDEVRCRYELADPQRSVWDFDVYVAPRYRSGRTLARLWKAVDALLGREGVAWTCSRISLYNPASVQAHERLGARCIGWSAHLVLGPWQWALWPKAPFVRWSRHADQAPCLRLTPPDGLGGTATTAQA